jgi:MFS family permease
MDSRQRWRHHRLLIPFRFRNYRLYFFGQSASLVGTWIETIALSWLVLDLTESASWLGAVVGARYLPIVLLGPLGGVLADRFDSRRLLLVTQTLNAVVAAALSAIIFSHHANVVVVMVLSSLLGVINVVDNPSRQTMLHDMVDEEALKSAVGLSTLQSNVARVAGPTIAGFLIVWPGIATCFALNAATFIGVVLSLLMMRDSELRRAPRIRTTSGQIVQGMRYIAGERTISWSLIMVACCGALVWEFPVSLPILADRVFGGDASLYGTLYACIGVGAIIGAIVVANSAREITPRLTTFTAILWGAFMFACALAPSVWVEMVCLVGVGVAAGSFSAASKMYLQMNCRADMRGRVMSIWFLGWSGTRGVGGPVVGWVGEGWGARAALLLGAGSALVCGAVGRWMMRDRGTRTRK